ncbi:oligopeptidase F. Metallo peptidase. MEROPS family M03B [Virgibacillus subterraneus]|uniref:Oligopeptidase F n=1 Tax=Virgibacillus subterraneus TaxID=621109 RepID=A0A1H9FVS5_9BACI|nr:oligoendopeptidase F [Virgibacillus subterraneus]SEQ41982.1 oligopeptidase F. Metallo peptidase. MEROPS family M03B [Virgibacillus subterraneus]
MTTKNKRWTRSEVPTEQTWNLTDLFSTEEDWEKELIAIQANVSDVTQFKGRLNNADNLLNCLVALENFEKRLIRIGTYANLRASADGTNPKNQGDMSRVSSVMATLGAKLTFIESELLEFSPSAIEQFINNKPGLESYRKMLEDIMDKKPFTLSPEIEETLAALGEVHSSPYMIYQRSKSSDMTFAPIADNNGEELPMSFALYEDRYELSPDKDIRRKAYDSFIKTLSQYKNTYAATYATEVTKQVKMSNLRSYNSVTEMLLQSQQVTQDMYHNQLDVIQKELAPHMRRFAKLKQDKLGLNELHFSDLKAPLDPEFNPETTYEEATSTILEALQVMGPEYSEIMKQGVNNRWVDQADNVGKATGAFCASPYGVHPYILITWTNTMRGAFILAHELGHAGHFYLAGKNQSLFNTRPSTYFVEAPSTLNELLLADHLIKKTDDKRMKRWVITQLLGTYYHNFVTHLLEGEFQRRIYDLAEEGTPLTADVLSKQKKEALENFWGDTVTLDEGAGLTWMRQPHYYMGLYPYTYSAGLTVSTAVVQMIQKEGQPAVERWLSVLKAGGSMKPQDLIEKAGLDMSKPDAIKGAVAYVGELVDELEKSYK